jgi:hypothetical protein
VPGIACAAVASKGDTMGKTTEAERERKREREREREKKKRRGEQQTSALAVAHPFLPLAFLPEMEEGENGDFDERTCILAEYWIN